MSAAAERGLFAAKGQARAAGAVPAPRDAARADSAVPRTAAEEAQPALPLAELERPQADEHQPGSLLAFRLRSAPGSTALPGEIVAALAEPERAPEQEPAAAPAGTAEVETRPGNAAPLAEAAAVTPRARAEVVPTAITLAPAPTAAEAGPANAETAPMRSASGGRIDRPLFPPAKRDARPVEPAPPAAPRMSPARTVVPAAAAVAAIAVVGWLVTQTGAPPAEPVPAPIEEPAIAAGPAPADAGAITSMADAEGGDAGSSPATAPAIETATAQEATPADIAAAPAAPPATQTMAATLVAPEPPQPVAADPVPASGLPSLDLVRAEPGAPPVIAGRAAPGSRLIVLDNGAPLGEATADANGEWAMVGDAPLAAGRHELTLALETPDGSLVIEQAEADLAPAVDPAGLPIPAQKPAAGAGAQGYVVQLASVPTAADAEREWARLQIAYPGLLGDREATVDEAEIGGRGTFFRLRTGPFTDRGDARALCGALNGAGQDCLVIRGVEGN